MNDKFKFRFEGLASSTNRQTDFEIGETVGVRYLPDNPKIARIDSFGQI